MNFCELFVWLGHILSFSVKFLCGREILRQLLSTFRATRRPSLKFHQLSEWAQDLPSTSVKFLCGWETFCQIPSHFCVAGRFSVNFRQLFVPPGDLNFCQLYMQSKKLPSTFRAAMRSSVNIRQLSVRPQYLPSTSIIFLCGQETFRQLP